MKNGWLRGGCFGSFVLLAIVVLAGCGGGGDGTSTQSAQIVTCPPSGTTNVTIQEYSFTPASLTISANDIVKWTNNGSMIHTVTSGTGGSTGTPDGEFGSGNLGTGGTVCVQFFQVGAYPYFCTPHPFMTGTVTVQ